MNDYLNVIRSHYADFRGRARRREYWMFMLFNWIVSTVLSLPYLITSLSGDLSAGPTPEPTGLGLVSIILASLYSLAVLLPSLAVAVRRLHDTGRSGWWLLLSILPFIGGLVLFIFYVLDSQPGANRWGPNPKGNAGLAANDW